MPRRVVKVAVVGSGLAGLTAGYLLGLPHDRDDVEIEVHLFERSSSLGMDSSSISLDGPDFPQRWRVDVPMRSFQGGYYTQLIKLYKTLGLQLREADFSYSFSSLSRQNERRSITTDFIYNGASGRAGFGKPAAYGLSAEHNLKGPERESLRYFAHQAQNYANFLVFVFQYILCFLITFYCSLPFRRPSGLGDVVFCDWVDMVAPRSYLARLTGMDVAWQSYVQMVLVPMFSAICTSPAVDILNHPMEDFLDYIWLTFGTHHYVVSGGVCTVVDRLQKGLKHINLSSTIMSIQPDRQDLTCATLTISTRGEVVERPGFHHIIFATQAPAAAYILTTYLNSLPDALSHRKETISPLIQCLKTFETRTSVVINHTDDSLLPDDDRDIRELNLITAASGANLADAESKTIPLFHVPETYTMATQVLRGPKEYSRAQPHVFQSTNPIVSPRRESIMSVAKLDRAVVTKESKKALELLSEEGSRKWWQCPYQAQTRLGPLQGCRATSEPAAPSIWVCGAFAHTGIPLLEGCVASAKNVVEQGILETERIK